MDGRTPPPPALSSGYAKRAWQMPTPDEGEDEVIGSGYRRARAGYVFFFFLSASSSSLSSSTIVALPFFMIDRDARIALTN